MSRPPGSGVFDDTDIARALESLEDDERRWVVALEAGISEAALKSHHRRRRLTWTRYLEQIRSSASLSSTRNGIEFDDDGRMRGVLVRLDPPVAEALQRLARAEERPVQLQAARLLREGLKRHGVLPRREPQALRAASSDAA